jgi:hypothetical protein
MLYIYANTSAGNSIAYVAYNLSTYTTLTAGLMTSVSVVRNVAYQGSYANYTFTFTTNGIMQNGSYIELDLPYDQILPKTNLSFLAK